MTAIAARQARYGIGSREPPTTVVRRADQCRKAGTAVEAGPAKPVHRSVARDQCGGLAISDDGIVFDLCGHHFTITRLLFGDRYVISGILAGTFGCGACSGMLVGHNRIVGNRTLCSQSGDRMALRGGGSDRPTQAASCWRNRASQGHPVTRL